MSISISGAVHRYVTSTQPRVMQTSIPPGFGDSPLPPKVGGWSPNDDNIPLTFLDLPTREILRPTLTLRDDPFATHANRATVLHKARITHRRVFMDRTLVINEGSQILFLIRFGNITTRTRGTGLNFYQTHYPVCRKGFFRRRTKPSPDFQSCILATWLARVLFNPSRC